MPVVSLRYAQDMDEQPGWVTVFRSADTSAQADAEVLRDLLADAGLSPVLLGDDAPGVPAGAYEVRVPPEEASRADQIVAASPEPPPEFVDASHDLDTETIFDAMGSTAELEALAIRGVLDVNGIPSVLVSGPQYPNLQFVVRVPKIYAERARRALEEAQAAGPDAAEEAERESEGVDG